MINVKFQLNCTCKIGEQFLVVGNHPLFGSWDPANAIPMTWSEENVWNVDMVSIIISIIIIFSN